MSNRGRVRRLVDGGSRAPGCFVAGCAEPIRPGALICRRHAEVLRPVPVRGTDGGQERDAEDDR